MSEDNIRIMVRWQQKGNGMGNVYGYIRVSSREQNEDRQMIAMDAVGIDRKNIFLDKQSGRDFDRPQ